MLSVANEIERSRAREAVRLITEGGYNRGKDLAEELEYLCKCYPLI
jgi:hypothetical protein